MPILTYSQRVYETVIKGDTVTVIPKHHAKQLAKERIMYKSLQVQLKEKDSLIDILNMHINTYKGIINGQQQNISDYKKRDSISTEISKSYQREIETLNKKNGFKKIFPYIAGVLGFILGIAL